MSITGFWEAVDNQLEELKTAKTADDVLAILAPSRNPYGDESMVSGSAFFAGGGGDYTPADSLRQAGWTIIWAEANYCYAMRSPDGQSSITYVEGDIYRGDTRSV